MKKLIVNFRTIALIAIVLTSCAKKPEEACVCIQQAANDFMVQGVKIESIDDLREPCKDLIDQFKEDASARALISETGTSVLESIEKKELIKIEGEELPVFPTYTFNTLAEFIDLKSKDGGIYKYWKTEVTIKDAFISGIESQNDSVYGTSGYANFTADITDKNIGIRFPKKQFDSTFSKSIELPLFWGLFDSKSNNFIKYNSEINGDIRNVIEQQLEYPNGDGWVETQYRDKLKNIISHPGFENFVQDLKNGRYLWLGENDINSLRKNEFGNKNIMCLTTLTLSGTVQYNSHENLYIVVSNASNFKHAPLPKIFEKRSQIDVSRFLQLSDWD